MITILRHPYISPRKNDNIMDENNQRKIIAFERFVSIGTQDNTYYYNDEFWDSI